MAKRSTRENVLLISELLDLDRSLTDGVVNAPAYELQIRVRERGRQDDAGDLGPSFIIADDDQQSEMPLSWLAILKGQPVAQRKENVEAWQRYIVVRPALIVQTTIPLTSAAKLLGVSKTYVSKQTAEYRLRWIDLPGGYSHAKGSWHAKRIEGPKRRLVSVADVLALAAERLHDPRRTHLRCGQCEYEYMPGEHCPHCKSGRLRSC